MKKYLIILIAAVFFTQAQSLAQTDSRNRTPETVIADALAQMPAKDSKSYSLLMGEMASTGSAGILQIASTMNYDDGKASAGEYALQGLASYVMTPEGGRHRDEVRKGLKLAIGRSGDVRKKRFLIASLALCATPADLPDLIAIANDKELEAAIQHLAPLLRDKHSDTREAAKNALLCIAGDPRFENTALTAVKNSQDYKELMALVEQ